MNALEGDEIRRAAGDEVKIPCGGADIYTRGAQRLKKSNGTRVHSICTKNEVVSVKKRKGRFPQALSLMENLSRRDISTPSKACHILLHKKEIYT